MRSRQFTTLVVLGVLITFSPGCSGQPRVTVITSTMVGLEAKPPMGDGQPNPSVNLAYKRAEMVLVPVCHVQEYSWWQSFMEWFGARDKSNREERDQNCPPKSSAGTDAYAVAGSFQMQHNWFGPLNIRQFIATGMVARHLVTPTVHVVGAVTRPGRYPFTKDLTAEQAIDMAGGRTDQTNPEPIEILRHTKKGEQVKISGKPETFLAPDDVVSIREDRWFYINGEVRTPGRYPYKDGLIIEEALTMAGERTEKGVKGKIKATQVRKDNRTGDTRELGEKAPVLPGDIILVEPEIAQPPQPSNN